LWILSCTNKGNRDIPQWIGNKIVLNTDYLIPDSVQQYIDQSTLVFTVKSVERKVSITGWESARYECSIGKIIKGNLHEEKIDLYIHALPSRINVLEQLSMNDKLMLGFTNLDGLSSMEGFRTKEGTKWRLDFIFINENIHPPLKIQRNGGTVR
jgi:hypothetical protein